MAWCHRHLKKTIKIYRRETMSDSTPNVTPTEEAESILIWLGKLALVIAASAVLAHFGASRLPNEVKF